MRIEKNKYDVIVIGAGQSGLAIGYFLGKAKLNFIIIDENPEVGFSWRSRYDSLILFSNARHDSLKGLAFPGDQNRYPTKDEMSSYLKKYIETFKLPVKLNTKAIHLTKNKAGLFVVKTLSGEIYLANNVVIATGYSYSPFIPEISKKIPAGIPQIHSSNYKNPDQINGKTVLIVGGGNSGVQIVEDLAKANKTVFFSFREKLKPFKNSPLRWLLLSIFAPPMLYFKTFLIEHFERLYKNRIVGTDLKKLFKHKNIILVAGILGVNQTGIVFKKQKIKNLEHIIWATGFKFDFKWIKFSIFDERGYPKHNRGITKIQGLYFLGFSWLQLKKHGFITSTSSEARYIFKKIEQI